MPPATPPGASPRPRRAATAALLFLLAALALALRWDGPPDEVLYPDAAVYMREARGYLEGYASIAPPWLGLPAGGPVFPALTALLAPAAGGVERAGTWVARGAGVALVVATAGLGLALGGPLAAAAAGGLAAVEPRLIHFSQHQLTETLFTALLLAAAGWAGRIRRRDGPWGAEPALGALLGVLALTRGVGLTALPAVVLALVLGGRTGVPVPWRRLGARALRVAAGGVLVVGLYQAVAWSHGWTTAFDTHAPAALAAPAPPGPDAGAHAPSGGGAALVASTLRSQAGAFGTLLPPVVWVLALAGLVARGARLRRGSPPGSAADLATDWALLAIAGAYLVGLSLFGTALARYLVVLFPVAFIYAGVGLAAAVTWGARRLATRLPGPAWPAPGLALLAAGAVGAVATFQVATAFRVPERGYAPMRALALEVAREAALAPPVAVAADHAFFPYYLDGYWRGPAVAPERMAGLGGSRVVLLDSAEADGWPAEWQAPALDRRDVGPFRLVRQHYDPDHGQLLTVYTDAPPAGAARDADAPPASGAAAGAGADGLALLRQGRMDQAARAFARTPGVAGRRGLGVMEMVAGQFFPARLFRARALLADGGEGPDEGPDAAPDGPPPRWRWAPAPGELIVATDAASAAWNRAAVALALGDAAAAARELPALERGFAGEPRARYLEGLVLTQTGRVAAALPLLRQAREGLPDDPGVAVAWANVLAMSGRLDAAVTVYLNVLKGDPENAGVWLNLIQARLAGGDLEGARRGIDTAGRLPLDPDTRARLERLAQAREQLAARAARP